MSESITEKWNRGCRGPIEGQTRVLAVSAAMGGLLVLIGRQPGGRVAPSEQRICFDWKLIRVVSGLRWNDSESRVVGSFGETEVVERHC